MRLFYDVYSTRTRAEVSLLCADVVALAAAVLYATGAIHPEVSLPDVVLLVLWTAFPRAFAKIATRFEHAGRMLRVFGGSLAFVLLTSLLLLAGWDLLASVAPRSAPAAPTLWIAIFAAWVTGFFVFHPRTYRLLDFLLLSVVLFGLKDSRPYPALWMPIFFSGFFLSTAIRHVLIDALRETRHRQVNLQNTRVVALLAVVVSCGVLLGVHLALRDVVGASRKATERSQSSPGGGALGRERGAASGPELSPYPVGATAPGGLSAGEGVGAAGKVIGFSYRVELRDLALARFDTREILRVQARGQEDWRPSRLTLWKAVSLSRFDAENESWEEETQFLQRAWPADGRLRLGSRGDDVPSGAVELRYRVVTPVFANLLSAYTPREYVSRAFSGYRVNPLGDIYPSPRLAEGSEYVARVDLLPPGSLPPTSLPLSEGTGTPRQAPYDVERYLEVPPQAVTGVDLEALAAKLRPPGRFADVRTVILALQRHYQAEGFRYSNRALWRSGRGRLRAFLERERTGDCTYFSTSTALALRAAGVPTRLAVGFLGGAWDDKTRETVIRNQDAHAWAEAFVPGQGWHPVDATAWVPPDPSYQPPPEALEGLEELASTDTRLSLRGSRTSPGGAEVPDGSRERPFPPGQRGGLGTSLWEHRSEELAEGELARADRSAEELDQEAAAWIEYGGFSMPGGVLPGASDASYPEWAALDSYTQDGLEASGEIPPLDGRRGATDSRPPLGGKLRALLRGAIPVLAALVLLTLLRTYLKPRRRRRRRKKEEDDDGEPEDVVVEMAAGERLDRAELEGDDPRARILREYVRLQRILRRTRSHRRPHETPMEHARGVSGCRPDLERSFLDLHRILYHIVYAGGHPKEEHVRLVARSCRRIARALG